MQDTCVSFHGPSGVVSNTYIIVYLRNEEYFSTTSQCLCGTLKIYLFCDYSSCAVLIQNRGIQRESGSTLQHRNTASLKIGHAWNTYRVGRSIVDCSLRTRRRRCWGL